jgi:hypothetical protein
MRASASSGLPPLPNAGSAFLSWVHQDTSFWGEHTFDLYAKVILFFEQSHSANEPEWLVVGHQRELLLP